MKGALLLLAREGLTEIKICHRRLPEKRLGGPLTAARFR